MSLYDLEIAHLRHRQGCKWREYPDDVLPAWVADMDFDLAPPIKVALSEALASADLGYARAVKDTGVRELLVARLAERYAWEVDPAQVDIFTDVVQGIYFALLGLLEAGEGVLIQTPVYPPFLSAVAETERRRIDAPLVQTAAGYVIDFDALRALITSTTRVLLLCHPHNPTGRAFTREELEELAEIALTHGLYVISDEIHADLMLVDRPHIPFASLSPEIATRTLTLVAASKAFNIAGLCIAFCIYGSDEIARRLSRLPHHLRGGRSSLGLAAVKAAWTEGQPWLDHILAQLRTHRDSVAAFVARYPAIKHTPPEATYLAWLDCRDLDLSVSPQRFFLDQARVALSNGAAFGAEGRGFVRLNFATSSPVLNDILARMAAVL